jgi:hypothetical protein
MTDHAHQITITFKNAPNRLSAKVAPSEAAVLYADDFAGHLINTSDTSATILKPLTAASYSTGTLNRPVVVN